MSVMDTTGFSQIGKFGTLSLLKRLDQTVITSFGIDSEELTFGRDPSCSIRLYYPDVSPIHCRIVFEERKAFLAVLGETGLMVDGCEVFPNATNSGSPTLVPLANDSEIEIHQKRFRFTYPPKDMRATLFATPSPKDRKPRLSMIQSAEVFTPGPSNDPRENLRILRSPLKNKYKSPVKPSLLSRAPMNAPEADSDEEEEDEIVLVDGNYPRVVEEERDLVILEDVPVISPLVQPQPSYQPPQTPPRRKSMGRNTLHRAVLIRSAQRAVMRAEEEEEEMEVLESVVVDPESSDGDEDDEDEDGHADQSDDDDSEMQDVEEEQPIWRKRLGGIWPFAGGSDDKTAEGEEEDCMEGDETSDKDDQDEEDFAGSLAPLPSILNQTPARRPLGSFFTPQHKQANPSTPSLHTNRLSLGGEARRVLVEQPWRVRDLVVSRDDAPNGPPRPSVSETPRRHQATDEDRKAIQERRRSALRQPDNFFPGGVPGMSPTKPPATATPLRPSIPFYSSPVKGPSNRRTSADEEELDTRGLLQKMKETVEVMKQRKSLAPGATPQRPLATPRRSIPDEGGPVFSSVKKLNLGPSTPVQRQASEPSSGSDEDGGGPMSAEESPQDTFSLFKPEARKEVSEIRKSLETTHQLPQDEAGAQSSIPTIVESMDVDEESVEETEETQDKPTSRSRSLRSKKIVPTASDSDFLSAEPETTIQSRRRSPRPRSPQPGTESGESGAPAPAPKKPTTGRRTRVAEVAKTTATKRSTQPAAGGSDESDPAPAPAPVRGRKVAVPQAIVKPRAARRGRKPATVKQEPVEDSVDEQPAAPIKHTTRKAPPAEQSNATPDEPLVRKGGRVPKPTTATAAAKKRGGKSPTNVVEDAEDDPLDFIDGDGSPLTSESVAGPSKTRGKKTTVTVKEEAEEVGPAVAPATKPNLRGRAAGASSLKTPAAIKPRAARKTPATAPAAIESGDKENTPGGSGSGADPSTATAGDEAVVKLKVSRSRGKMGTATATKGKAAVKTEATGEEPAGTRVTRMTRARTKTG